MMQKDIFMQGEGNAWLNRNRDIIGKHDPVSELIEENGIRPARILEVGCADGWRLAKLRERYGAEVFGVEPSRQACIEAIKSRVPAYQMTACCLPIFGSGFDMIIYGFCLYMADPKDWFTIVAEGDRALADGGYLIVHDFIAPEKPYAKHYEHRDGVLAYHVDFANLWLAHPLYGLVTRRVDVGGNMVSILKKLPVESIEVRA